jgi:hypothetical protein
MPGSTDILLFGGTAEESTGNLTREQINNYETHCLKIGVLDVANSTYRDTGLRMIKGDFFYFNQACMSGPTGNERIYALGKDHIHIIERSLQAIDIMLDEGDYG